MCSDEELYYKNCSEENAEFQVGYSLNRKIFLSDRFKILSFHGLTNTSAMWHFVPYLVTGQEEGGCQ